MNELLVMLEQNWCEPITYADDIILVISYRFIDTIIDRMQLALRSVCVWASDRGENGSSTLHEKIEATAFSSTETEQDGTETQGGDVHSRTYPE